MDLLSERMKGCGEINVNYIPVEYGSKLNFHKQWAKIALPVIHGAARTQLSLQYKLQLLKFNNYQEINKADYHEGSLTPPGFLLVILFNGPWLVINRLISPNRMNDDILAAAKQRLLYG
jgi:hypothetical protein